jgi:hypothetical protein
MRELDEQLDDALGHVRAEQDAGRITELEAAAERIGLLERHIAECQRLRRELRHACGQVFQDQADTGTPGEVPS